MRTARSTQALPSRQPGLRPWLVGALVLLLGLAFPFPLRADGPAPVAAPAPKPRRKKRPHKPAPAAKRWPGQGDPAVEQARLCILKREAGGDYTAADPTGQWFGGYQFAQTTSDTAARRMHRPDLVGVPANQWAKADQDAAFYLIWDRGRGKQHWAGGRYPCFQ